MCFTHAVSCGAFGDGHQIWPDPQAAYQLSKTAERTYTYGRNNLKSEEADKWKRKSPWLEPEGTPLPFSPHDLWRATDFPLRLLVSTPAKLSKWTSLGKVSSLAVIPRFVLVVLVC